MRFGPSGDIPNNPDLPVVIMAGAFAPRGPDAICSMLEENGWGGTWVWTVFGDHHFHPDAHEALAVASGHAALMLGGPDGRAVRVSAGDALVLPAGTGHRLMTQSPDFRVCGAYPPGQAGYSTRRAATAEDARRIAAVPLPDTDPVHGADGPVMRAWRRERAAR
nr:cupin domain-containing protein [Sagittula salina]